MLEIIIKAGESFNEATGEFLNCTKDTKLTLEHSLVSISKWESKWKKPFLKPDDNKSTEEIIDYIKCMTITPNIDENVYNFLSEENLKDINEYINDPMTATTFPEDAFAANKPQKKQIFSSELIYGYMIQANIPFECQKWHISRLLTLIRVCGNLNKPDKKMSQADIIARNRALNAQRRAKYKTAG